MSTKRVGRRSVLKAGKTHGFRTRMSSKSGRIVIKNRRSKGRSKLSA